MDFEFVMHGRRYHATRERVVAALQDVLPEPLTPYMVEIEGASFPVKQAFAETFGLPRKKVPTERAKRLLERLGFTVTKQGETASMRAKRIRETPHGQPAREGPGFRVVTVPTLEPAPYGGSLTRDPPEFQEIAIPTLALRWSYFEPWDELARTVEVVDGPYVPSGPGVYEVTLSGHWELLYIGQASDLRKRVKDGLVKGSLAHTAGERMRQNEDTSLLRVRWAETDWPAAAEEALHKWYLHSHGRTPVYAGRGA